MRMLEENVFGAFEILGKIKHDFMFFILISDQY